VGDGTVEVFGLLELLPSTDLLVLNFLFVVGVGEASAGSTFSTGRTSSFVGGGSMVVESSGVGVAEFKFNLVL
jgi:hypothetical protein